MEIKDFFTEQLTVEITLLKVNNKKLTKTLLNQFIVSSPFDKSYELKPKAKIFGFVNDKGYWIIWSDVKYIYKFNTKELMKFNLINFDTRLFQLRKIYSLPRLDKMSNDQLYENQYSSISEILSEEELKEITEKQKFLNEFFKELYKKQIFL